MNAVPYLSSFFNVFKTFSGLLVVTLSAEIPSLIFQTVEKHQCHNLRKLGSVLHDFGSFEVFQPISCYRQRCNNRNEVELEPYRQDATLLREQKV